MRVVVLVASVVSIAAAAFTLHAADQTGSPAEPITFSQSHRLASGHWMKSEAILSRTGRVDVFTRTWSNAAGSGFHGAVVVFLVDEHQNRLYSTRPRSYGVNSKHLPGDSRTDSFHEAVPNDVVARAHGLVIQHLYQPNSEVLDRLRDAKAASGYLAGILRDGAEILLLSGVP